MCKRFTPFSISEAQMTLDQLLETGGAHIPDEPEAKIKDAFPGSLVPLFLPNAEGKLQMQTASWGFALDDNRKLYFNTRLETALQQYESKTGLWAKAIRHGRCLVPVHAFYENHHTDIEYSPKTGKPIHKLYRITYNNAKAFLLAGVYLDGRFSVVTTEPNNFMAPIHNRMPLVLGRGESRIWLSENFGSLADRNNIPLIASPAENYQSQSGNKNHLSNSFKQFLYATIKTASHTLLSKNTQYVENSSFFSI